MKLFIILGALNGFIAVALGAFGAHGLEGKIPDKYLETWQTAVQYQMFHAVGLLVIGLLAGKDLKSADQLVRLAYANRNYPIFRKPIRSKRYANQSAWCHHTNWRSFILGCLGPNDHCCI